MSDLVSRACVDRGECVRLRALAAVVILLSMAGAARAALRAPREPAEPLGAVECLTPAAPGGTMDLQEVAIVGRRLVTLQGSGLLLLADLDTGRTLNSLQLPRPSSEGELYRMAAVRGTEQLLVSAGFDLYRCDVSASALALTPLPVHAFLNGPQSAVRGHVLCAVSSPASYRPRLALVDPATGALQRVLGACDDWGFSMHGRLNVNAAALSDDGTWFVDETMNELFTWDVRRDRALTRMPTHYSHGELAVGGGAVARCAGPRLALLDAAAGAVRWERRLSDRTSCHAPELSPDGRWVAYLVQPDAEDPALGVWTLEVRDAATGALVRSLALDAPGWTAHWSPDGSRLIVAGRNGRVRAWDTAAWAELPWSHALAPGAPRHLPSNQPVPVVATSRDGARVATAVFPGEHDAPHPFVTLAPAAGATAHEVTVGPVPGGAVALTWLTGRTLVVGGADGHLRVFDADAGREAQDLALPDAPDLPLAFEREAGGRSLRVWTQRGADYRVGLR